MASVLKVDSITGVTTAGSISVTGEGNSTTTNLQQGLLKAWVNFNGTGTIAVRESFNTSGITDEGTGHYSTSFTNALTNADYVVAGTAMYSASTNAHSISYGDTNGANGEQPTSSRYEVLTSYVHSSSAAPQDCTRVQLQTSGDLA
tara:strand:- start:61 stop:498 length:438 start_codon:yes stop_codon:yes gene_type:complete